jgi:ATP-dependent Clp protease adaptor protein ClpS
VQTVLEPEIDTPSTPRHAPLYHVIILNDEDHTIDYVVEMLGVTVGLDAGTALARTLEADRTGSAIVHTCGLDEAETKRDRIHAYGPDWRLPHSRGSVAALVEPADR